MDGLRTKDLDRRIRRFTTPLIVAILSLVWFLCTPILVMIAQIVMLPFGGTARYIASELIAQLYLPALTLTLAMGVLLFVRCTTLNLGLLSYVAGVHGKPVLAPWRPVKDALMVLLLVGALLVFTYGSLVNIANLILDIPNAVHGRNLVTEGKLQLRETGSGDAVVTHIYVNGILFPDRRVSGAAPQEGHQYRIWYLPHCLYIVKLQMLN